MDWRSNYRKWRYAKALRQAGFASLLQPAPAEQWVSLDCETTSLNPKQAELLSVAAIPIERQQVRTSEHYYQLFPAPKSLSGDSIRIHKLRHRDLQQQGDPQEIVRELLQHIGPRTLVGYYISFDIAVLSHYCLNYWGFALPNPAIELSSVYHQKVARLYPDTHIDLRFNTLAQRLAIPSFERHSAYGDALMAALMHLRLHYGPPPPRL